MGIVHVFLAFLVCGVAVVTSAIVPAKTALEHIGTVGTKEIYLESTKTDWFTAAITCRDNGMKLLSIRTEEELSFLGNYSFGTERTLLWLSGIHNLQITHFSFGEFDSEGWLEYGGQLDWTAVGDGASWSSSDLVCQAMEFIPGSNKPSTRFHPCRDEVFPLAALCQNSESEVEPDMIPARQRSNIRIGGPEKVAVTRQ